MKSAIVWVLTLVVLGGAIYLLGPAGFAMVADYLKPPEKRIIPTTTLRNRDYVLRIPASGELAGLETITLTAPRVRRGSLKIKALVEEGSIVSKGAVVIQFDETDAQLALEENENQSSTFLSRIEQTEEDSRGELEVLEMEKLAARNEVDYSESQIRKDEDIFSRWEIQESMMSAALARYKEGALDEKVDLQGQLSEADLRILNIEQGKVKSEINLAQEALSSLAVTAPVSGVVIYKRFGFDRLEVGREVWRGQQLMEIARLDQFRGIIQVPERDVTGIEAGQKVDVRLEALPELPLSGEVRQVARIAKQIIREDPRKYFECELLLDVAPALITNLKPGMKLTAEIEIGQWENAAVLPSSSIIKDEASWIAFVVKQDEYREVEVTVVATDHGFLLVEGLEEGATVCLKHPHEDEELILPDFSAPSAPTSSGRFAIMIG